MPGIQAKGVQIDIPGTPQWQAAVEAVELHLVVGPIVEGIATEPHRTHGEGIEPGIRRPAHAQPHAIEGLANVGDIAVGHQHLGAVGHFLAADARRQVGPGDLEACIDERLLDVRAALVRWRQRVLAPGPGVLHLGEQAQLAVQQVQIGVRLQALHQVRVVGVAAHPEVR